ncbi:cell division protein FtsZ [Pseudochelatococcus lubricantis]|uniref:Cell division protein FtsZ n=1 Tax=Pseudochelatococcus lubricantis TaxID=1538102 RepID=A0ABX0V375_9HYPH|nr:cell division protein FtsZ [Pseudochelatococcus lubricantis]NIJ59587.1 cell division protein FtsZ [Pseudochelatococcus lubricantis]
MAINLQAPDIRELKPHITVFGVGGAGGNAVNNMIESGLQGVEFVCANTDAQALMSSRCERIIQMGTQVTEGLGAGSQPDIGRAAAEEVIDEIRDNLSGAHMVFITAGMGGGTGTGAAPVIAQAARDMGILTVGVVTKPFQFEGARRMRVADAGIQELQKSVDTLIVIPNQNLFRVANEKTTFADAFTLADQVLYSGVACITDLMVKEGLINLDFADVRSIMRGMGKAMMGTGEASGEKRAITAAEAAIANPLLDDVSMKGARGLLISITGGNDLTLYEVDEAATRIREEVDSDANIILGATFDPALEGIIRVSVVATGIEPLLAGSTQDVTATEQRIAEVAERLRSEARLRAVQGSGQIAVAGGEAPQAAASLTVPQAVPVAGIAPTLAQSSAPAVGRHDVVFEPAQPRPNIVPTAAALAAAPAPQPEALPEHFLPPRAEQTVRPARMPRVDELPLPAQNQIRASRGEAPQHAPQSQQGHDPRQRMSLLQRLASVGLGRRDEPAPQHAPQVRSQPQAAPQGAQPQVHAQPQLHAQPHAQPVPQPPVYRPAQPEQQAVRPSVPAPRNATIDDEQLEIPAFLRRQAN